MEEFIRSKDPRIIGLIEKIRRDHPQKKWVGPLLELVLRRLDEGQKEHKSDYKEKDIPAEIEQEFLDLCFGWPIMQAYKNPKTTALVRTWVASTIGLYGKVLDFAEEVKKIEKEELPKVLISPLEQLRKEEVTGDERYGI